MSNRAKNTMLNWIMLIALVVVFASGVLLKPFPGMWLGITHSISGAVLVISIIIHCVTHGMFRKTT